MKKKYLLLIMLSFALLLSSQNLFAQTEDDEDEAKEDSIIEFDDDFDFDPEFLKFSGKPTISLNYGFGKNSHIDFLETLSKPNLAEVRFGYTTERTLKQHENLMRYQHRFLSFTTSSNKLGKKADVGDVELNMTRLSMGWDEGYGYVWGKTAIILYNSNGIAWNQTKVEQAPTNLSDANLLAYHGDDFRIGTKSEGGIKFQIVPAFVIDASYERGAIYPRLLFWKAAGSSLIEHIGSEWVEDFVQEIFDSSPIAVPIVNFVLMNGYSYLVYDFRKEKMNFPFNTTPPFMYETFKVGMSFIF